MLLLYISLSIGSLFFPILMIFLLWFLLLLTAPRADFYRQPFRWIRAITHSRRVDFSVPKTELNHWCTPLQHEPPGTPRPPPVALDGQIFHCSAKLQWLGYWFVPMRASSAHISRWLAFSQAAFSFIQRLSDAGKSILPHVCHRLAYFLMFPILSYGADLFTPTKGLLNKMEVYWK